MTNEDKLETTQLKIRDKDNTVDDWTREIKQKRIIKTKKVQMKNIQMKTIQMKNLQMKKTFIVIEGKYNKK